MSSVQTFIAISSFYISPGGTLFIKNGPADRSIQSFRPENKADRQDDEAGNENWGEGDPASG